MRNLLFLFLAAAFIFGSNTVASAQEWVKLAPEGGSFEVMMPGTAKTSEDTGSGDMGTYTTRLYIVSATGTIYLLGYVDYSKPERMDIKGEMKANRDNFLKPWKESKILTEKEITFGTHSGMEFTAQVDGRLATSRIIMVGKRPYQLVVMTALDADQSDAAKFLNSFKLTRK